MPYKVRSGRPPLENMPCDCGRPAAYWFGSDRECERCHALRIKQAKEDRRNTGFITKGRDTHAPKDPAFRYSENEDIFSL